MTTGSTGGAAAPRTSTAPGEDICWHTNYCYSGYPSNSTYAGYHYYCTVIEAYFDFGGNGLHRAAKTCAWL